ncbi:hypothetical protein [Microbulbifer sp. JMSA002]|uniref:hypothetical protein n=1 Tax=Microbulbifer sp. JMSA002 TaxID=3243368 RepID=UPI0040395F15
MNDLLAILRAEIDHKLPRKPLDAFEHGRRVGKIELLERIEDILKPKKEDHIPGVHE